jgi:hypothetical protein
MTRVIIVVPDAGPLISLARAERLDLLTALGLPVYIMDQVRWEATHNREKPDAVAIAKFIETNSGMVHIETTETGENARVAREAGRIGKRQASLGEAAISEFLTDFEARFEDVSPLLIYEVPILKESSSSFQATSTSFQRKVSSLDWSRENWWTMQARFGNPSKMLEESLRKLRWIDQALPVHPKAIGEARIVYRSSRWNLQKSRQGAKERWACLVHSQPTGS